MHFHILLNTFPYLLFTLYQILYNIYKDNKYNILHYKVSAEPAAQSKS